MLRKTWAGLIVVPLILAACAKSPQQVEVNPPLSTRAFPNGYGQRVYLEFKDTREKPELGSRGGVYSDSSLITFEDGYKDRLQNILAQRLRQNGYTLDPEVHDVRWTVELMKATYDVNKVDELKDNIVVSVKVGFIVEREDKTYSKSYTATRMKPVFKLPDDRFNSKMINQVLADAVDRMLADETLQGFLSNAQN